MNIRPIKNITTAFIVLGVLTLLGFSGSLTTASAAGVTINGGTVPVTNYAQVTLAFTPPVGAVQMSFRNEASDWSAWESVASTKQWTLSAAAGVKTVSVQFRDSLTASNTIGGKFSASITLDYSIDTSFASPNGYESLGLTGTATAANAVAVDSSGRKVVVGTIDKGNGNTDLTVVRYLVDGSLDTSFNVNGKYTYGGPNADTGKAVAIDALGNIVVVGSIAQDGVGNTDMLVLRLTPAGVLDGTFGTAGVVVYTSLGAAIDTANAVAIQADGKIVVAGTVATSPTNSDVIVMRLTGTGGVDTTFGSVLAGLIREGLIVYGGPGNDSGNGLAIQADGKIVVAGTYDHGAGNTSAWVIRLDGSGSLDTTFGTVNGPVRTGDIAFGDAGADSAAAVTIQGTKIVVVGTYDWAGGDTDVWVLQLLSDGTPDVSFNGTGSKSFGDLGADSGSAVAIQGTNVIVVGTYDNGNAYTSLWATRLTASGAQDTAFNFGSDYTFGASGAFAGRAVAQQADGKIILAGIGNSAGLPSTLLTVRVHDKTYPLTVATIGSGTVAVFPGTLTAGTGNFVPGSTILLTATPVGGASFIGWSGDCTGTGICSVTMTAAKNVTATFSLPVTLNLTVTGVGTITATSSQGVIACTSNCSNDLPLNTVVNLTATPAWYSQFVGWSGGGCTGNGACSVTMSQVQNVRATFDPKMYVRLNSSIPYSSLYEAYIAAFNAGPTATLDVQAFTFLENLSLNKLVTLTFHGGKDANYSAVPIGYTTISGSLKISSGRLNASNLKVKP